MGPGFPPKCVHGSTQSENQSGRWAALARPPSEGFRCGLALGLLSGLAARCHRLRGCRVPGQVARGLRAPGLCLGWVPELGTWGPGRGCERLCLNNDSSVRGRVCCLCRPSPRWGKATSLAWTCSPGATPRSGVRGVGRRSRGLTGSQGGLSAPCTAAWLSHVQVVWGAPPGPVRESGLVAGGFLPDAALSLLCGRLDGPSSTCAFCHSGCTCEARLGA